MKITVGNLRKVIKEVAQGSGQDDADIRSLFTPEEIKARIELKKTGTKNASALSKRLKVGDPIVSSMYGRGTVTKVNGARNLIAAQYEDDGKEHVTNADSVAHVDDPLGPADFR